MWNTVIEYIQYLQETLLRGALKKIGLLPVDLYGDKNDDALIISSNSIQEIYSDIWSTWEGRETEFYINCYELVKGISVREKEKIVREGITIENRLLENIKRVIKFPEYLVPDEDLFTRTDRSTCKIEFIHNISNLDKSIVWSFEVPCLLLDNFNGKVKTKDVLQNIRNEFNMKVDYEIIISLFHHGILKEVKG